GVSLRGGPRLHQRHLPQRPPGGRRRSAQGPRRPANRPDHPPLRGIVNEEGVLALVEVAQLSDTGRVRHHNEDRSLATPRLLAVADGMGGAKAGEVAAQVAVDSVAGLEGAGADQVRAALEEANRAIRRMAADDPDKSGMGTTMTTAMMRGGTLDVVHVGDSRAYLWRDETLTQVTEDHSVVGELVRRGSITAEEAERHPHRNVIT
ncbi:unnamed protein product, partial [Phaeothamnion confervicola]